MSMILLCSQTLWQPVINAIPGICLAIITLVSMYVILKNIIVPIIGDGRKHAIDIKNLQYSHEENLKKESFEQEKFWALFKQMTFPAEERIKELQNELEELKKQKTNLENSQGDLEKDKSEFEKILLEEKVKMYEEVIKVLGK